MSAPVWVCYGGGVDSTAMLIEMVNRGERIDLITFNDMKAELEETTDTVTLMDAWLRSKGYPGVTVTEYRDRSGQPWTLEQAVLKNGTLPSLAFGFHTCSLRFKVAPQLKVAKAFPAFKDAWSRGEKVIRVIGYDNGAADGKRACRDTTQFPDANEYTNRYPLREWGWDRERCKAEIAKEGMGEVIKSACFFCPARKKHEIDDLAKRAPHLLERALRLEAAALASGKIKSKSIKGLGRNFSWAQYVYNRALMPV
jgi:hypothetical protein